MLPSVSGTLRHKLHLTLILSIPRDDLRLKNGSRWRGLSWIWYGECGGQPYLLCDSEMIAFNCTWSEASQDCTFQCVKLICTFIPFPGFSLREKKTYRNIIKIGWEQWLLFGFVYTGLTWCKREKNQPCKAYVRKFWFIKCHTIKITSLNDSQHCLRVRCCVLDGNGCHLIIWDMGVQMMLYFSYFISPR